MRSVILACFAAAFALLAQGSDDPARAAHHAFGQVVRLVSDVNSFRHSGFGFPTNPG